MLFHHCPSHSDDSVDLMHLYAGALAERVAGNLEVLAAPRRHGRRAAIRARAVSESESAETLMPPDEPSYRTVLGHFATGVTIITAMDGNEPIGVSANSFSSVSLDPPLVLFCASKDSSTWPKIEAAGKFTVNILNEHQEDVCRVFATKGADRFSRIGWRPSAGGSPILHDALAYIDCTIRDQHDAGDHLIVVGLVQELGVLGDEGPLIFYRGGYGQLRQLSGDTRRRAHVWRSSWRSPDRHSSSCARLRSLPAQMQAFGIPGSLAAVAAILVPDGRARDRSVVGHLP